MFNISYVSYYGHITIHFRPLESFREHGANLQLPFALIQNAMLHMMDELQSVFKWVKLLLHFKI